MTFMEFVEQDKYCRTNNIPEGIGCKGCQGEGKPCADKLRRMAGQSIDNPSTDLQEQIECLDISKWNQLDISCGYLTFNK